MTMADLSCTLLDSTLTMLHVIAYAARLKPVQCIAMPALPLMHCYALPSLLQPVTDHRMPHSAVPPIHHILHHTWNLSV